MRIVLSLCSVGNFEPFLKVKFEPFTFNIEVNFEPFYVGFID